MLFSQCREYDVRSFKLYLHLVSTTVTTHAHRGAEQNDHHNSKKFIAQQLNYARTSAVMHAHNR